jgi:hypothetical protein
VKPRLNRLWPVLLAVWAIVAAGRADARVVRVVVDSRQLVAGGQPLGAAGPCERIVGRVFYAFDPGNPHDRQIVDLALAPRNERGEVEAWGDFVIVRPADPARRSGLTVVDVTNRGGQTTFVFNLGARRDASPDSAEFYGDAFLLARGITVAAIGWQFDVPPEAAALLHFTPPQAGTPANPVTGLVRSDVTIDQLTRTMSLGHGVGASRAVGYPVADPADTANVLTVRDGPTSERRVVPRATWRFAREDAGGAVVDDPRSVYLADGFQPGRIYELVYRATGAVVVGTGLAAVRDFASYLKYDETSIAPTRYAVAYGVSQTGRFLRHFLHEGFNADEQGRKAFDGVFSHTAGAGRGSFNHRFAQPSRDAQPYSTFFYPTDVFPFTSIEEFDPETGARGALLGETVDKASLPKVFYVDGGYEYWGRAASLAHVTVDGRADIAFTTAERRYVIASAQHSSPAAFPPAASARVAGQPAYRGDVLDQRLALRALMAALADWVTRGAAPPPSSYPTLARRELVPSSAVRFPTIPGVAMARVPGQPYRVDYGPRWAQGIVDTEPPRLGTPYTVLVPAVDAFGNDAAGIRSIELRVPLATYFPWQLRTGQAAGADRLVSFAGTFVPLPRTEADRRASGDSRPSIARLYPTRDAFLHQVDRAAAAMVRERVLLPGDVAAARQRMAATWDWIASTR